MCHISMFTCLSIRGVLLPARIVEPAEVVIDAHTIRPAPDMPAAVDLTVRSKLRL